MIGDDFKKVLWSSYVFDRLQNELGSEREAKIIRLEVETGRAAILEGYGVMFIYRVEGNIDGTKEFVIIAMHGKDANAAMDKIADFCYDAGIAKMRFHSRHPVELQKRFVEKYMHGFGYFESSYVREVF